MLYFVSEMITHSSIPAWRIPWTKKPGGLRSTGSQRDPTTGLTLTRTEQHATLPACPGTLGHPSQYDPHKDW